MTKEKNLLTVMLVTLLNSPLSFAQAGQATPQVWQISADIDSSAHAKGLPVLALEQPDWPSYRKEPGSTSSAFREIHAEVMATHPNGWQISALVRAQAWLQASPDAVTVAALEAMQANPSAPTSFNVSAHSQSWQGQGVRVGTPWLALSQAGHWQWHANAQLLNLTKLRTDDIAGAITYTGAGAYDFQLAGQRANTSITAPFVPASDTSGQGVSLSLGVRGTPVPRLSLSLQADDVLSSLNWQNMAQDTSVMNSQVITRAPDGTLNYAALINGKIVSASLSERISTHWQANASWALTDEASGAVSVRAENQAGQNQFWFGWHSANAGQAQPQWVIEAEPQYKAVSVGMHWGHWRALVATDGNGIDTQYRHWSLGWQTAW